MQIIILLAQQMVIGLATYLGKPYRTAYWPNLSHLSQVPYYDIIDLSFETLRNLSDEELIDIWKNICSNREREKEFCKIFGIPYAQLQPWIKGKRIGCSSCRGVIIHGLMCIDQ